MWRGRTAEGARGRRSMNGTWRVAGVQASRWQVQPDSRGDSLLARKRRGLPRDAAKYGQHGAIGPLEVQLADFLPARITAARSSARKRLKIGHSWCPTRVFRLHDARRDHPAARNDTSISVNIVGLGRPNGRRAADTSPRRRPSRWAGPVANRVLADTPVTESAVSVHRARCDSRTACLNWQNTAERAQIPGKDGGRPRKVLALGSDLDPAPQAEQSPLCCPSAHVEGSGNGSDLCRKRGLLGGVPAAIRSQACCRQRKLKGAAGASQSGKIVKVFPHGGQIPRRTQMHSRRSSWAGCLVAKCERSAAFR